MRFSRIRSSGGMVVAAILAGAVLTACSTSVAPPKQAKAKAKGSSGVSSNPASSTTPSPTTPPTATSTPASSSSSTPATTTACPVSALSAKLVGTEGGAGVIEMTVALQNAGTTTCTLQGYPGLLLIGSGGTQLATHVSDGGPLAFESVAPTLVSLAAGQSAYFNIGVSDVPSSSEPDCPSATSLQVIPPGDANHLLVPVQVQPCGGGQLNESSVFGSGSAAMQTTVPSSTT
jgi:hypothetical protein